MRTKQDAQKRRGMQVGLGVGMTVLLAGCVINPYVKTAAVPRNDPIASTCKALGANPVDAANARNYAECIRRAMESKAGRYAWMNNGGTALLMQMAGFAGYSGVRGGHQAQVAAFTTGGASIYGAQQYLYRKPREAIYWSGSNAIGCAIGVTERRTQVATQAEVAGATLQREYLSDRTSLGVRLRELSPIEAVIKDVEHCDAKTKNDWAMLHAELEGIRSADALSAIGTRRDAIYRRLQSLASSGQYARIDLIATTNAIRDTVNRQLAIEQPDPAELNKILASLKLPVLQGAAVPEADADPVAGEAAEMGFASMMTSEDIRRYIFEFDMGDKAIKRCGFNAAQFEAFRAASQRVFDAHAALDQRLGDAQSNLDVLEERARSTTEDGSQLKYCTLAKTNALMPFGLQLAQQGAQKVVEGQALSIPITGGVPPYAITPLSTAATGITAMPKPSDDGGFHIEVSAASASKSANAVFFANDAVGAGTVFAIEVVGK